jgi:hypothetical protein
MDTVRVNICYRPLRICWAIAGGDFDAFRLAVRLSFTMWGGRFNPIVIVDHLEEAEAVVEVFRADLIVSVGTSEAVKTFPARFPHLINPLLNDGLFLGGMNDDVGAQVLDVHNALVQLNNTSAFEDIKGRGFRLYQWDPDDPLADVLLMFLGGYPDPAIGLRIDYRDIVKQATDATEHTIDQNAAVPAEIFQHPSIAYLARHGLTRHYGVSSNWDYPGFFLGDASNLDDLVCSWNLRAADTGVLFVDRNHLARYEHLIPDWSKTTNNVVSRRRFEHHRKPAVWTRRSALPDDMNAHFTEVKRIFGDAQFMHPTIDISTWNGLNIKAPMMILGETAQLGVLTADSSGKPKLSFALGDKPFCGDVWFHTQHLVASLSFIGGLYGDDLHTLSPPYLPELNEFYARTMHFQYDKFRIEPERIGLVIDAADSDAFIYALPVADLFEKIFRLADFSAAPSSGGLITRQLITQMGGLQGAAVFKIPGVRRLLKTFGPTDPFTANDAINKIGSKDPDNPAANFKDFEDLYIEPRPHGTKLKATDVFTYLVEKGLFRMGSQLTCPHCRMTRWIALDVLKQRVTCEMCGREFDATRQLVTGVCHYRRSGLLGSQKDAQGAVPVALTLQQLDSNLSHTLRSNMYSTSLDLKPLNGAALPTCEVDFVWVVSGGYPEKTTIILGECKDRGRKKGTGADHSGTIDPTDISNLKTVAEALPKKRFQTFVLLAKLCPFTQQEIDAAKTLNDRYRQQAILLTSRELEPWHIYQRTKKELKIDIHGSSAGRLAQATAAIYFPEPPQPPAPEGG